MKVYDRALGRLFQEDVYGDFFIRLAYSHSLGRKVIQLEALQKGLSSLIGFWQRRGLSKRAIPEFIRRYKINRDDFIEPEGGYASFNDFFIRTFKDKLRSFPENPQHMGALAEGRLSVFTVEGAQSRLSIKGKKLSLAQLLSSIDDLAPFAWGHALVFRLCPVDYHRFHFPDSGLPGLVSRKGNKLHSVNPLAQKAEPELFFWNERQLTLFRSEHFGPLFFIEVGALGVGRIHQSFEPNFPVKRGQEKGYFEFGGSTVILLTQRKYFEPDKDLIERSEEGLESLVRLGEKIGVGL